MSSRIALVIVSALLSGLLAALPEAAAAGKAKSPMWVTIDANGDIANTVDDATKCVATVTTTGGWVALVGVTMGHPTSNAVSVHLLDIATGEPVAVPYHLVVHCPK